MASGEIISARLGGSFRCQQRCGEGAAAAVVAVAVGAMIMEEEARSERVSARNVRMEGREGIGTPHSRSAQRIIPRRDRSGRGR